MFECFFSEKEKAKILNKIFTARGGSLNFEVILEYLILQLFYQV
jgi:hypothetical protein